MARILLKYLFSGTFVCLLSRFESEEKIGLVLCDLTGGGEIWIYSYEGWQVVPARTSGKVSWRESNEFVNEKCKEIKQEVRREDELGDTIFIHILGCWYSKLV